MARVLLSPRPLSRRKSSPATVAWLLHHVYCAVNRWSSSCELCGNLPIGEDGLCWRCRKAPLDTALASDLLAELRDLEVRH